MTRVKNLYHLFLAWLGSVVYRHPSRELIVIGITGTKGKTTSVELLAAVLQGAGKKVAMLSSVHSMINGVYRKNTTGNSMPGRFFIQRFLREAVQAGCAYAVLEVTSQGAVQSRHRFIHFDACALTCLHPEHIESHGSFENYREAKVQFFRDAVHESSKQRKHFFINSDSADARFFEEPILHATGQGHFGEVVFYNRRDFVRDVLKGEPERLGAWLTSDFNTENAAMVYAITQALAIDSATALRGLQSFKGLPGRMEWFTGSTKTSGGSFDVVVDYAHTPGSFEALFGHLRSVLQERGSGALIAVFGSYGEGRDAWKRPELGRVASRFCDRIFLTNEGPGDENPQSILAQIQKGVDPSRPHQIIEDRREAIKAALASARAGDIVALVGKGHESYIRIGKKEIPWNERAVAEAVLAELA